MAADSTYSKELADYAVNFIECLCHAKGTWAGEPFELIDWQEQIIRDIFGTIKLNGYRQFTTAYVEIPKKMGKSELAAAVALLLTCGDGEERAEVYGCAADRQQATIVFIDPTFYLVIYGADENDDWTDPAVWKKANPSLGITVGIDKVQAACESAQQNPYEAVYVTVAWTFRPTQTSRLLYWCSRHWMRMINMWFSRISGYRKIRWNFECAVTMFHTMSGRSKVSCRPPKEM